MAHCRWGSGKVFQSRRCSHCPKEQVPPNHPRLPAPVRPPPSPKIWMKYGPHMYGMLGQNPWILSGCAWNNVSTLYADASWLSSTILPFLFWNQSGFGIGRNINVLFSYNRYGSTVMVWCSERNNLCMETPSVPFITWKELTTKKQTEKNSLLILILIFLFNFMFTAYLILI